MYSPVSVFQLNLCLLVHVASPFLLVCVDLLFLILIAGTVTVFRAGPRQR